MRTLLCTFVLAMTTAAALPAQAAHLTDYDRQIVASCMVLEAGCDGVEGMQAVLNVILTRADGYLHLLVPQTIKPGAFSCMSDVWHTPSPDYSQLLSRAQNQDKEFNEAIRLIKIMEQGLLWDNTYGATHYHATSVHPYWADDMHYLTTIGGHHFYTDQVNSYASL